MANHFNAEIISADSRQFYKEMHIGTAAPSASELKAAKHHFIKHLSVENYYNVGDFERDAIAKLKTIHSTHDVAIMVGGSGLYVDAVTKGLDNLPKVDFSIRDELNATLIDDGLEVLQFRLKKLDPRGYDRIAIANPKRVIRALEVCISSGKPYSSFLRDTNKTRYFKTISIGLTAQRPIIYDRINQRVDMMMVEGLLEEVKLLKPQQDLNALNTVGYKELFKHLNGEWSLDIAIREIKKNTRRFAKRQMTWFKRDENTIWFDYNANIDDIVEAISKKI